jgi:predicted NBD/HSP70 family sugar kinase
MNEESGIELMKTKNGPANRQLIRDINQNSLLNLIKTEGPVARTRLAELSGLSLATISYITGDLLERNLVLESGAAESTGGRKPVLLEIQPEGGFAIGLKLTEYEIIAVILNLNGEIVYSERFSFELRDHGQEAIALLADQVQALILRSGLNRPKMIGLGCGMPGLISSEDGVCIDSPILDWHDVAISEPLGALLKMPVYIDNDVNSLAIYEKLFGQGQPFDHFLTITLGRGVGLGLVINGDVYRGGLGGAGEFGHTTVVIEGRRCECGNRGCLEAYASDRGIVQTYFEKNNLTAPADLLKAPEKEIQLLLEKARSGDRMAREAFGLAGKLLGISLANLVNLLNPQLVLLSGSGAVAGPILFDPMQEALQAHTFSRLAEQMRLTTEPTGDESWARGAASLVLRQFFLSPVNNQ